MPNTNLQPRRGRREGREDGLIAKKGKKEKKEKSRMKAAGSECRPCANVNEKYFQTGKKFDEDAERKARGCEISRAPTRSVFSVSLWRSQPLPDNNDRERESERRTRKKETERTGRD